MIKVQMQTFQVPRWLGPVLALIALALIPFALVVGLAALTAVVGFTALRVFLPSAPGPALKSFPDETLGGRKIHSRSQTIDAEYEVKDGN
jgi:hypothetical protein